MNSLRQEYSALLATLEPGDAVNVLNDRVDVIFKTNSDIANWLLERRKVEETYAQGLRKLAGKPQRDGGVHLGIFQLPWQRIIESTESLAQSHEGLAQKIEVDAEMSLRNFATQNKEMQGISTIQGNLASIAKDFNTAQKKADKLKDKTGKHSLTRAANASSTVDDANQQWETQAPYVFEQLQSLDEARINHLRDVLTQFQTHEVDSIEQNRKPAELCLNALLNMETADEIKTFAAQIKTGPRPTSFTRRQSSASTNPGRLSTGGEGGVPPVPPLPRLANDGPRQTPKISEETGPGGSVAESKETPKKHGLKSRLGTVMGRRKNAAPPPATSAEKTKKERNRSSLMPFRRADSSRSHPEGEDVSATKRDLASVMSEDEAEPAELPVHRRDANRRPAATEGQERTPVASAVVNGTTPMENEPGTTTASPPVHQSELSSAALTPSNPPLHELSVTPPSPVQRIDAISRAQQEAAATNAENEEAMRRLKIRDQPIREDETEAQQAMSNMANQLRLQAQSSGVNRLAGSVRGRRDVRNTIFVPNLEEPSSKSQPLATSITDSSTSAGIDAAGPPDNEPTSASLEHSTGLPTKAPSVVPEEKAMSDTTSVHSAQSSGATVHHPEMHEPGLNASIVETVSTWFSDGTVSKSVVIGEVALAYNSSGSAVDSEVIRLNNFQMLEKVAPNPNFVSSSASEKGKEKAMSDEAAGEYSVTLSAIKRSAPVIALRYQLHLDPSNLSACSPVLLTPAWQIQDAQASVIVIYTLNPAFFLSAGASSSTTNSTTTSVTLKNVVLSITLDPSADAGKASSAMMAPQNGAAFKRKQGLVVWKLPELLVAGEQQKLLARFATTGPKARPGHVEARWELPGTTGSSLGVSVLGEAGKMKEAFNPFADDGTAPASPAAAWNEVNTARGLISGRYSAC